tara:strand:+ start:89 stop:478 length:390 start_codon:yes stop_codon:yes gene_type:complete
MKTIFTNGCFDVLHRGHLELLAYCSSLGRVVVGINSDESIRRLKGSSRPIICEKDRKFHLECLRFVDEVLIFSEDTPYNLIKNVKPDIIVKGDDYNIQTVVGNELCEVKIFKKIKGYSSSQVIQDITDR